MQSVEAVDNYIEGIVAATWNHQLWLHQFMLIIKLCNTWLTLDGIAGAKGLLNRYAPLH